MIQAFERQFCFCRYPHRCDLRQSVALSFGVWQCGHRQHGIAFLQRTSKHLIATGLCICLCDQFSRDARNASCPLPCKKSVRLGKQDVEANDGRVVRGDLVDQCRHAGARPRPLTERREALFVDRDDNHRFVHALKWKQPLVGIEHRVPQGRDHRRFAGKQHHKRNQHDCSAESETIESAAENAVCAQSSISIPS